MGRLHDILKQRVGHELTRQFCKLVAGGNVLQLIVGVVSVAVEQFGVDSSYPLAFLVHHSDEEIGIVLARVGLVPILVSWVDWPITGFKKGE